MMLAKGVFLAVAIALFCLSVCKALTCTGGVHKSTMNTQCMLNCGETEKCLCAKDENPSNITNCQQNCNKHPTPGNVNTIVNKCPDMECRDLENCYQNCNHGKCSMHCKASKLCTQECSASCTKIVCSSGMCAQSCQNCTMECTSGVKSCQQSCQGGTCYYKCNAKECHKSCVGDKKCELKVLSDSCTGGVHKSTMNTQCMLNCGETEKCLCAKDENPSIITNCQQNCNKHPTPGNVNTIVNKCPDMECRDLENCFQNCNHGKCSMHCKANKVCAQECSASCTKIVCSSGVCAQSCQNCTMECTSGVKSCQQNCQGGTCYYKCNAKECHKSCVGDKKCELKVLSDSGDHLSASSLVKMMFLVVFLVQIIH